MRRRKKRFNYAPLALAVVMVITGICTASGLSFSPPIAEVTSTPSPLYLEKMVHKDVPPRAKEIVVVPTPEPEEKLWTDEEVEVLAKMVYGEARGVPSKMEQAACVWCVLNRCDEYGKDIIEVTTAPYQFVGYREHNPIDNDIWELCEDVLSRWYAEKSGETDVGRVLPSDYLYFHGDGSHNHFRNEFKGGTIWDWSYPNPYET